MQYVSATEAGRRLGISTRTVIRMIRAGELPAVRKRPAAAGPERHSHYMIAVADIERIEQRRRAGR